MLHHKHSLFKDGVQADGVVLKEARDEREESKVHLEIGVAFEDGTRTTFTENVHRWHEVPEHTWKQLGALDNSEYARLLIYTHSPGNKIPVRYDPKDRTKIVVDEPAMQQQAIQQEMAQQDARRERQQAQLNKVWPPN